MTRSRFVVAFGVSIAALLVVHDQSFAEDHSGTVLDHAGAGPLRCEIHKTVAGDQVELAGEVASSVATTGSFRFVVTKSGPAGSSNTSQGNTFNLAAGKESHVGQVRINLEPDAQAVAELVATSGGGVECRAKAVLKSSGVERHGASRADAAS